MLNGYRKCDACCDFINLATQSHIIVHEVEGDLVDMIFHPYPCFRFFADENRVSRVVENWRGRQ
jgi:hypothetical protein